MSRNGAGVYALPGTYEAVDGETAIAEQHNDPLEDLESDANTPRPVVAGGTGASTAVGAADALHTKGSNIASATTTNIAAASGDFIHITGTTTITAFGTADAGVERDLVFDAALILTHNATSLILPGAANITTAAGDTARMRSEGSGNWRCIAYQRAGWHPDASLTTFSTSGTYALANGLTNSSFGVSGGSTGALGANLLMYGESTASTAFDILFRHSASIVYSWDDSAGIHAFASPAGTTVLNIDNTGVNRAITTDRLGLSGGSTGALGANMLLFGESHASQAYDVQIRHNTSLVYSYDDSADTHAWYATAGTERARLNASALLVGQSSTNTPGAGNNTVGIGLNVAGGGYFSSASNPLTSNRTADGVVWAGNSGGTQQCTISIAGATGTFNAFLGAHWSQTADGSRLEIRRGSIVESIDMMASWPAFRFTDHAGVEHVSEAVPDGLKPGDTFEFSYQYVEVIDTTEPREFDEPVIEEIEETYEEFEVVDGKANLVTKTRRATRQLMDSYPLFKDGEPVFRRNEPGKGRKGKPGKPAQMMHIVPRRQKVTRQVPVRLEKTVTATALATVFLPPEDRLPRFQVCQTAKSPSVVGVFADWDDDWKHGHDARNPGVGFGWVLVAPGVEVKNGDLIESSDYPGCGRVQADDIIRSCTVGKITAAIASETHPDGARLYPCALYCG